MSHGSLKKKRPLKGQNHESNYFISIHNLLLMQYSHTYIDEFIICCVYIMYKAVMLLWSEIIRISFNFVFSFKQ